MLPSRNEIKNMNWREIQRLALSMRLSKRGESFRDTALRLYFDGMDEEAEIFEAIAERSEILGRHGDDSFFTAPLRIKK